MMTMQNMALQLIDNRDAYSPQSRVGGNLPENNSSYTKMIFLTIKKALYRRKYIYKKT